MRRTATVLLAMLLSTAAQAAEYMAKTPFQLSRAFSPGVVTSGGITVWVDGVLKSAGGSLDNVVAMTVFIKESRYGDKFVEMRKDFFKNGNYPGSALITVT